MKKLRTLNPKGYSRLTFESGFTLLCKNYQRFTDSVECLKYYTMSTDREGMFHSWSLNKGSITVYEKLLRIQTFN